MISREAIEYLRFQVSRYIFNIDIKLMFNPLTWTFYFYQYCGFKSLDFCLSFTILFISVSFRFYRCYPHIETKEEIKEHLNRREQYE